MSTTTTVHSHREQQDSEGYYELERIIAERVADLEGPLFTTDVTGLYESYLENLPAERRQHYNCRNCQRFIEKYGGLVKIDTTGKQIPVLWEDWANSPDFFRQSVSSIAGDCYCSRVNGVFINSEAVWGVPKNTNQQTKVEWTHLSGVPSQVIQKANNLSTADQVMAERKEEYAMLRRGLAEFPIEAVQQAVRVLKADALYRSEKALAIGEWLLKLHENMAATKNSKIKDNLAWWAVATAPTGFCHIRTTVISTLLQDIVDGLELGVIQRRWSEKLHPLQYQRPTTLKEGSIKEAEKLVEKLGVAKSLERRFAKLEEVTAFWKPVSTESKQESRGGVFSHLSSAKAKKTIKNIQLPTETITWDRFCTVILPNAIGIELKVPAGYAPFTALVTAADPNSPAILQWDGIEGLERNPVSHYMYHGGSLSTRWLPNVTYFPILPSSVKVNAICSNPSSWQQQEKFKHQGEAVMFILEGCRDTTYTNSGGLFPECLKAEFHGIRSVVEAYSKEAVIAGKDEATACGLWISKGMDFKYTLKVKMVDGDERSYLVDRWI
jgi:hypothetical protein